MVRGIVSLGAFIVFLYEAKIDVLQAKLSFVLHSRTLLQLQAPNRYFSYQLFETPSK